MRDPGLAARADGLGLAAEPVGALVLAGPVEFGSLRQQAANDDLGELDPRTRHRPGSRPRA